MPSIASMTKVHGRIFNFNLRANSSVIKCAVAHVSKSALQAMTPPAWSRTLRVALIINCDCAAREIKLTAPGASHAVSPFVVAEPDGLVNPRVAELASF